MFPCAAGSQGVRWAGVWAGGRNRNRARARAEMERRLQLPLRAEAGDGDARDALAVWRVPGSRRRRRRGSPAMPWHALMASVQKGLRASAGNAVQSLDQTGV